jgi:hypothetical protein
MQQRLVSFVYWKDKYGHVRSNSQHSLLQIIKRSSFQKVLIKEKGWKFTRQLYKFYILSDYSKQSGTIDIILEIFIIIIIIIIIITSSSSSSSTSSSSSSSSSGVRLNLLVLRPLLAYCTSPGS